MMMQQQQPLVSIIIPVFNTAKYLDVCLKSILVQTYSNFEAIIINDGSTDESAEIAIRYCEKDSRFRLWSYENSGLSVARNRGIKIANGQYITFIDSDDFVSPTFVEELVKNILATSSDIVMLSPQLVDEEGRTIESKRMNVLASEILKPVNLISKFSSNWIFAVVWGKLYRKDLFLSVQLTSKVSDHSFILTFLYRYSL